MNKKTSLITEEIINSGTNPGASVSFSAKTNNEPSSFLYHEEELTPQSAFAINIFMQDNLVAPIQVFPHWHDCFEILLILKGTAVQSLNQRKLQVKEHDLIIIKKGDVHSTQCEPHDDVKIIVIKFLPRFIDSIYSHSFESIYITSFLNLNISPIKSLENSRYLSQFEMLTLSLLEEFNKKEPSFEIAIKGYLSVLISLLVRLDLLVMPALVLKSNKQRDFELVTLLNYIEENALQENFNLRDIAHQFNFNYSYCSRYFKKHTGRGFHEFLTFIRVCEAERMIVNENHTITQAALESGFSNSSVFSKAYKRIRGYSPNHLIQTFSNKRNHEI